MANSWEDRKKLRERRVLDEARRARRSFQSGYLVPHEIPDFLLHADTGSIGIEVTELCREEPKREEKRLSNVRIKAIDSYSRFSNSHPIDVSATFAQETENIRFHKLVDGLANFIYSLRQDNGVYDWKEWEPPEGYSHISINPAREPVGNWRVFGDGPIRRPGIHPPKNWSYFLRSPSGQVGCLQLRVPRRVPSGVPRHRNRDGGRIFWKRQSTHTPAAQSQEAPCPYGIDRAA